MSNLYLLEKEIGRTMLADRHRFWRQLRALKDECEIGQSLTTKQNERLSKLTDAVRRSAAVQETRRRGVPIISYDDELPISAKRQEIAKAIRENQVVIICGETGSGKSTQLPKICLEMGRGIDGLIGHTQPRRIAARSVAARIAEELGSPLGKDVGFKVRFAESLSPQTYIKLMTDGILLAETQGDSFLNQYDTIIIDEAHERSLNVDFLIGYIKRLLPKRRDLKLIITSATIDAARFAAHFSAPEGPAPVVEVSGRTYPVEVRWRPPTEDEDGDEPDLQKAVAAAVDEVSEIDRGDILIFMPTERDIHETAKNLRGRSSPGDPNGRMTEILPLYARLSIAEQQKVFQPGAKRRIVIATNVAESSLTVPRIRFVIDPGTARISRYSPRTKTQRLPIEAVSRASADQRKGRCGRIGPGVCIRLFGEQDYLARDAYTVPEIQRTNLAAVILQTKALQLGPIERFPFIDPPKPEAVRDGYRTLIELGAVNAKGDLTDVGRQLSRLPVDPRIGRILLASAEEDCLYEGLIIASAMAAQDPRERPLEKQEAADASHAAHSDDQSDFVSYLKLWDFYHKLRSDLSRNQLQKACRQNFLSATRMREWLDVHRELMELTRQAGLLKGLDFGAYVAAHRVRRGRTDREQYDGVHRAILTGLLSNVALRGDNYDYTVAGGGKAHVWPGSGVFQQKPKWIVAAELIETSRRYMRTCAQIDPNWIERIAEHLIKKAYHGLHWAPGQCSAMALERVTLFGLTIVGGRRVHYGPIDPTMSRHLLLEQGLVGGHMEPKPDFLIKNEKLFEELQILQAKLRRNDLLVSDLTRYEYYDRRVPADVYDGATLAKWLRGNKHALTMTKEDLLREEVAEEKEKEYPDAILVQHLNLPLEYQYEPGTLNDGVTLNVPLEALNQVAPEPLSWLVPGMVEEKVLALIRSLPKALRTQFVPAPDTAKRIAPTLRFGEGDIRAAVAKALGKMIGTRISPDDFQEDRLPSELKMNVRVTDADGLQLAAGRDLEALRQELGQQAAESFSQVDDPEWTKDELKSWDFDSLPVELEFSRGRLSVKAYPVLIDRGETVSLRLADSAARSAHETHFGLRRLCFLAARRELKSQVDWLPNLSKIDSFASTIPNFDLRKRLTELLADVAMVADRPTPRSREEFAKFLAEGRERIAWGVQELATVAMPIFENYHRANLAIEELSRPPAATQIPALRLGGAMLKPAPAAKKKPGLLGAAPKEASPISRLQYAIDDVRAQIARLTDPEAFSKTPWEWLKQYPRYFKAICARLENLPGNIQRDWEKFEEFQPRWTLYLEQERLRRSQGVVDLELEQMRWMLEEYRVSLFAQKLGTAVPVSPKRLDLQWANVLG